MDAYIIRLINKMNEKMAHAAIHIHTYVQVCHAHTIKKNKKSQNMRSTHIAYYLCTIQIRLYVFLQRGASILSLGPCKQHYTNSMGMRFGCITILNTKLYVFNKMACGARNVGLSICFCS